MRTRLVLCMTRVLELELDLISSVAFYSCAQGEIAFLHIVRYETLLLFHFWNLEQYQRRKSGD
jgi:hypothetical protein